MSDHEERPEAGLPEAFETSDPATEDADGIGAGRVISGEPPQGDDPEVEEASEESFPGSDPPGYNGGRTVTRS